MRVFVVLWNEPESTDVEIIFNSEQNATDYVENQTSLLKIQEEKLNYKYVGFYTIKEHSVV